MSLGGCCETPVGDCNGFEPTFTIAGACVSSAYEGWEDCAVCSQASEGHHEDETLQLKYRSGFMNYSTASPWVFDDSHHGMSPLSQYLCQLELVRRLLLIICRFLC